MHANGDSIPFLEKLRQGGRETALDGLPQLDTDEQELWELYCFCGSDLLVSIDLYDRRVGLPGDWEFIECAKLVNKMQTRKLELDQEKRKAKTDD